VDSVVVCVPPQKTEQVLQDAAQSGLRRVWLQQGAETPQLVEQAHKLGMDVVAGKCILMYAPPVKSFHNFHRFFVRLFRRL
jgi:predicted CoA-binding protein